MSKKYYEKLVAGSGSTSKKVKSKFGEKIMEQLGWASGKGLGKNDDGMQDPIQITRRDEGTGLGDDDPLENENIPANKQFKWNNNFWDEMYNNNAQK